MRKNHQYRVTVEYLADKDGNPQNSTVQFDCENHDNIFEIIEKMKTREDFTPEMATEFAVGLKLMSEPMMQNPKNPLFLAIKPHFMEIMKTIKGKNR